MSDNENKDNQKPTPVPTPAPASEPQRPELPTPPIDRIEKGLNIDDLFQNK